MSAIFLDLDGTLMDSQRGIESSLRHALRETGHAAIAETDLRWLLGPPFQESFAKLGITNVDAVLGEYRRVYTDGGMFDATPYDGVMAMMDALSTAGHRLILMTAKPHSYARKITAHFGLTPFFDAEYGPETDGTRGHKADLLAHALQETGVEAATSIMVGDRTHDIEAAERNQMASVAVSWGYGTADEWAAADHLIHAPGDLVPLAADLVPTKGVTA